MNIINGSLKQRLKLSHQIYLLLSMGRSSQIFRDNTEWLKQDLSGDQVQSPSSKHGQLENTAQVCSGWFSVCPQPLWANCGSVLSPPQQKKKIKKGKKPKPTFFLHLNGISFCIHCVSSYWTPLQTVQSSPLHLFLLLHSLCPVRYSFE